MDNRLTILNCALELFSARGYDAVGVQEIAEAAGVTKPTLYHYYGNKQGLLEALIDTYQQPFNEKVKAACTYRGDLPGTLADLARIYFQFAIEQPIYYRLQLALLFAPRESDGQQIAADRNQQPYRLVESMFIAAAQHHGNMRERHALYAATYIGLLNTCIGLWLNNHLDLNEDLVFRIVQQFQYGIYS